MTILAPTYQIRCDEPGCQNISTFLLRQYVNRADFYEINRPHVSYAHWGGETLPDGNHRCVDCQSKQQSEQKPINDPIVDAGGDTNV